MSSKSNGEKEHESMFYLKHKGKKLYIESDNVYTTCPQCGKEHAVDLNDAIIDGVLDLYGLDIFCTECSAKRRASGGSSPQVAAGCRNSPQTAASWEYDA
ncbi:MAG TPA: hypothetical protein IAB67_03945 [Candidatus Ventrousia excrementavium]|uniref:Uncharacterized protein n=1 Tax=Candidatus Ventrousia excrementavium TaxID=2840961 RepID=A0A9D1IWR0_9CLOT|nr:hypothetical protein [Candidatus Ventrousia excrementavium]